MDELTAGMPAVQVMSEYVRAVRLLGHPTPEPTRLHTAYTAEEGIDLQALDADARALSAAAAAAEETLLLQEHARRTLDGAWRGAGGQAAAEQLRRHTESAGAVVDGLRGAAAALDDLRNRLRQFIDAKVETTLEVEARGLRTEWLGAARTVNTGAGDRSAASELVDLAVAPFVAHDIGVDWVSSMRDTEAAIGQAYRDAAAAAGSPVAVFERPGAFVSPVVEPTAAEQVWSSPAGAAAVTVPAGYSAAPAVPEPAVGPALAAQVPPTMPTAAPPVAGPAPVDPAAAMSGAPMPAPGGLGGGASPLGSGMAGLSGLGQSFADMLGGLLGSGGDALGDNLGAADDLGSGEGPEDLDLGAEEEAEDSEDEEAGDEEAEGEEAEGEEAEDEIENDEDVPVASGEVLAPAESAEPVEGVAPQPEPPVPTMVPEPAADPVVAAPAEPAPADTPCQIAADELPQAGP